MLKETCSWILAGFVRFSKLEKGDKSVAMDGRYPVWANAAARSASCVGFV